MDFSQLVTSLSQSPGAAIAALAILANAWQYKEARAREQQMLDIAMKIAPLADSLARAVESSARIADRLMDHKE